nr:hypothetical protein Iba_chr14aCG8680 [Ipomoea batatas]GMD89924.1 hypothetical protein Iba_chr14dCG4710 [Ipomoea batatas]GMD93587.1 hypothetical protein Iba_chr14fCG8880 [Ipomoea batatas]
MALLYERDEMMDTMEGSEQEEEVRINSAMRFMTHSYAEMLTSANRLMTKEREIQEELENVSEDEDDDEDKSDSNCLAI